MPMTARTATTIPMMRPRLVPVGGGGVAPAGGGGGGGPAAPGGGGGGRCRAAVVAVGRRSTCPCTVRGVTPPDRPWCDGPGSPPARPRTTSTAPAAAQGRLGGVERRAGRHHVVDDQHPRRGDVRVRAERRAVEPADAAQAGLRPSVTVSLEQPPARHPELAGDVPGHQFGLVEAPVAPAPGAGRGPRDDVDPPTGRGEPVDQQPGEMAGDGPPVPVLEAEQHVAHSTGERGHDEDPTRPTRLGAADEGEAAGTAQWRAGSVTAGASGREDHGVSMNEGCASVAWWSSGCPIRASSC